MLLCACTTDGIATFASGDAPLAVNLPNVCEAFLVPVPQPQVTRKTDARVAYVRAAGALDVANGRISGGRDCFQDQRIAYKGSASAKASADKKGKSR